METTPAAARRPAAPRPRAVRAAREHLRASNVASDLPAGPIPHTVFVDDPHASHSPDNRGAAAHLQVLCALLGQFGARGVPDGPLTP